MITLNNLHTIHLLANIPAGGLSFKAGSALNKLITNLPSDADNIYSIIEAINNDPNHEILMSSMVAEARPLLLGRVAYIRNTVAAAIEEIFQEIEDLAPQMGMGAAPYNILTNKIPDFLVSEALASMVNEYRDVVIRTPKAAPNAFPNYTAAELLQRMQILPDDKELVEYINGLVDSTNVDLVDIYKKWFCGTAVQGYPVSTTTVAPSYIPFMYTEWAIVHLLAQGFYRTAASEVNLSNHEYNMWMSQLISNTGKYLANGIKRLKAQSGAQGALVVSTVNVGGITTIILNKERYEGLVRDGRITPNEVMGLHMLNQLDMLNRGGVEDSLREKANLKYNSHQSAASVAASDRYLANLITLLMRAINKRIDDGEYASNEDKSTILNNCRKLIDTERGVSPERLFFAIRKVVCLGLYPNSGAFAYFVAMDQYQSQSPNMTPREAATLASCDVMIAYGMNQLAG